ncbi:MAG TPA: OsmC family protein [bacterium]|nr:OsmC family protein [bacterium]
MMSGQAKTQEMINGYNVGQLRARREQITLDASLTERNPELVARWIGASRARVEFNDIVTHIGGDGELNAMQSLLATLAACDIEVITFHAALLGIQIEELSIAARGHFNVRALWGFEDALGAGYDEMSYTVRLRAPGATVEQLAQLRERCERSSPVGDTLSRRVPVTLEFVSET